MEIYSYRMADGKDYFGLQKSDTQENVTYAIYDDIKALNDSLFLIEANTRKGVLDNEGNEIIPPIYNDLEVFDSKANYFLALQDGQRGIIHINGDILVPFNFSILKYDSKKHQLLGWRINALSEEDIEYISFPHNIEVCEKFNLDYHPAFSFSFDHRDNFLYWGLKNAEGKLVIACEYAEIIPLYLGYYLIRTRANYYGIIELNKQDYVIQPKLIHHNPYYDITWHYCSVSCTSGDNKQECDSIVLCFAHDHFRLGKDYYFICNKHQIVENKVIRQKKEQNEIPTQQRIFIAVEYEEESYPLNEYSSIIDNKDDVVLDAKGYIVTNIQEIIREATTSKSSLHLAAFKDALGNILGYDYLLPTGERKFHRLFQNATEFFHGYAYVNINNRYFFINENGDEFDTLHDTYYWHREQLMQRC